MQSGADEGRIRIDFGKHFPARECRPVVKCAGDKHVISMSAALLLTGQSKEVMFSLDRIKDAKRKNKDLAGHGRKTMLKGI